MYVQTIVCRSRWTERCLCFTCYRHSPKNMPFKSDVFPPPVLIGLIMIVAGAFISPVQFSVPFLFIAIIRTECYDLETTKVHT